MGGEKRGEVDLAQELRELGRQLMEAVRVAREHPQTKEFERQVANAVNQLSTEIDRALKSAQADTRTRQVGDQVKQAAQAVQKSGAPEEIAHGLAEGVRALNEQIRRAIEQADKK